MENLWLYATLLLSWILTYLAGRWKQDKYIQRHIENVVRNTCGEDIALILTPSSSAITHIFSLNIL